MMLRAFVIVCALTASATTVAEPNRATIVTGVSVVDVQTGEILPRRAVVIRDRRIESVVPAEAASEMRGGGAVVHDFDGKFVIPGLWDMHVHLRGGKDLADDNRVWMQQYVGNGVTTVRDVGGDIPDDVLGWNEAVYARTIAGPRILSSLRKIDGSPALRSGSVEIASTADIRSALFELKAAGADFIKVNDGRIADSTFLDILRQANELGLRTAAHIPIGVSVDQLADAGLGSIGHCFFLTKFASADEEQLTERFTSDSPENPKPDYFGMFNSFAAAIDDDKARRVFRRMADSGIALTPTIHVLRRWLLVDESTRPEDDAGFFETPESIRATHDAAGWIAFMNERTSDRVGDDKRLVAESQLLTGLAAAEGVTILAGSDTGTTSTFVYPGASLHHELVELVELVRAGLSPLQALQAATINAATWFGLNN